MPFRGRSCGRTLSPDTFSRLIVSKEDVLVPMAEDLMHHSSRCIFDVAGDVIQTCSSIALEATLSINAVRSLRVANLDKTDSSFVSQRAFHEHIPVVIDPSVWGENIVNAHFALVPRYGLVVFRKHQDILRIGKDLCEQEHRSLERIEAQWGSLFTHRFSPEFNLRLQLWKKWRHGAMQSMSRTYFATD